MQTKDEAGSSVNYDYEKVFGQLTSVTGPLDWSLGFAYDGDGDLTHFTDARGKVTQYNYGLAGELTSFAYPDTSGASFL